MEGEGNYFKACIRRQSASRSRCGGCQFEKVAFMPIPSSQHNPIDFILGCLVSCLVWEQWYYADHYALFV